MRNQNTFFGIKLLAALLFALMSSFLNAQTYEQVCLGYILNNKNKFKNPLYDYEPNSKVEFYYYPIVKDLKFYWEDYKNVDSAKLQAREKDILRFYERHEKLYKDTSYSYSQYKYFNKLKLKPVRGGKAYNNYQTQTLFKKKTNGIYCLIVIFSKIKINGFIFVLADIEFDGSHYELLFKLHPTEKKVLDIHRYFAVY